MKINVKIFWYIFLIFFLLLAIVWSFLRLIIFSDKELISHDFIEIHHLPYNKAQEELSKINQNYLISFLKNYLNFWWTIDTK